MPGAARRTAETTLMPAIVPDRRRRPFLIALAIVLVVGAVTVAIVRSTQGHGSPAAHSRAAGGGFPAGGRAGLATAAAYLGLSVQELRARLRGHASLAQIAAATPGRSASGLVDALVTERAAALDLAVARGQLSGAARARRIEALRARLTLAVQSPVRGARAAPQLAVAARYLGLSRKALRARLHSGATLAKIADATAGHSAAGLIEALVQARTTQLAAVVKAGLLTGGEAHRLLLAAPAIARAEVETAYG